MTSVAREFANAPVPDERLQRRLVKIAELVATEPAASFPRMARSDGELEGLYRFLSNDRVEPAEVLEPHLRATGERAAAAKRILALHDTTKFKFPDYEGDDLGYLPTGQHGFLGHFALLLDEATQPLGVGGMQTLFNTKKPAKRGRGVRHQSAAKLAKKKKGRDGERWRELVEQVEGRFGGQQNVLHVIDREGDSYPLLSAMVSRRRHFIVRLRQKMNRKAAADMDAAWEPLADVVERAPYVCQREVELSRRAAKSTPNVTHRPRPQRMATLHLEATAVVLRRPRDCDHALPSQLQLNLVRVHEVDAPVGEEPVEWWLLTTEPIGSQEEVEAVVDWYRARWRIEEFFKALKSGCGYEKRGLESREALLRALALLAPIAWQLLLARDRSRVTPEAPATSVFTARQLRVLRHIAKRPLSEIPTMEQVTLAIAGQGGHLLRNGRPGWQSLGRGLEKLWWAEFGYVAGVADATGGKLEM